MRKKLASQNQQWREHLLIGVQLTYIRKHAQVPFGRHLLLRYPRTFRDGSFIEDWPEPLFKSARDTLILALLDPEF